jgi:hypothetical protein
MCEKSWARILWSLGWASEDGAPFLEQFHDLERRYSRTSSTSFLPRNAHYQDACPRMDFDRSLSAVATRSTTYA